MDAAFLGGEIVNSFACVQPCTSILLIDYLRVGWYPCSGRLCRRSLRRQLFHLHLEHKSGALVHAVGNNIDLPAAVLHNLLTYRQSHAKSIGI